MIVLEVNSDLHKRCQPEAVLEKYNKGLIIRSIDSVRDLKYETCLAAPRCATYIRKEAPICLYKSYGVNLLIDPEKVHIKAVYKRNAPTGIGHEIDSRLPTVDISNIAHKVRRLTTRKNRPCYKDYGTFSGDTSGIDHKITKMLSKTQGHLLLPHNELIIVPRLFHMIENQHVIGLAIENIEMLSEGLIAHRDRFFPGRSIYIYDRGKGHLSLLNEVKCIQLIIDKRIQLIEEKIEALKKNPFAALKTLQPKL